MSPKRDDSFVTERELAQFARTYRRIRAFSLRDLSVECEIAFNTLSRLEQGVGHLSLPHYERLMRYFGQPADKK